MFIDGPDVYGMKLFAVNKTKSCSGGAIILTWVPSTAPITARNLAIAYKPFLVAIFSLVGEGHLMNFEETSVRDYETSRTLQDILD